MVCLNKNKSYLGRKVLWKLATSSTVSAISLLGHQFAVVAGEVYGIHSEEVFLSSFLLYPCFEIEPQVSSSSLSKDSPNRNPSFLASSTNK